MLEDFQLPESPYKGLVSYLEKDAYLFFGRERERDIITAKLLGSRLTLLYGPTGVGKTSILRAGVEHHLRELARINQAQFGKPEFVVVVFSIWRDNPLIGLLRRLRHCVATALGDPKIDKQELDSTLTEAIPKWSKLIGGDLLIILDQFEDYFLYHNNEVGDRTFFNEFQQVVNRPDLRASFLISIREDALAKLDSFKIRIPHIFDNCQRVKHLTIDSARSAIRGPIGIYNRMLKGEAEYTIEDELVEEVCKQVKTGTVVMGGTGLGAVLDLKSTIDTEEIETPYLQLVMTRLWLQEKSNKSRRLRLVTLVRLGGAEHIVETHLDNKMESLSPDQQRIASRIFANLVTPTGNKIAHTAQDLAYFAGLSKDLLVPVLEELSSQHSRILRTVSSTLGASGEPRYEIFHDILATPVLDWRTRYNQEQERLRLEEVAKLKQEQDKKLLEAETRSKLKARYRKVALIVMSIITILMISLTIYSLVKRDAATSALKEAKYQKDRAQAQQDEAVRALAVINELDRSVPHFLTIMRGHNDKVNSVDFSPDARFMVTASSDHTARKWDVDSGRMLFVLEHTAPINKAVFNLGGDLIASVSDDRTATLWDAADGRRLLTLAGHTGPVKDVSFSSDGKYLATASDDHTARIWDLKTGNCLSILSGHTGPVTTVSFSPSAQSVVTASADKTARIWRTADGMLLNILKGHLGELNSANFSPNNRYVVTASNDGTARLYDAGNGVALAETKGGHTDKVNIAVFSPDGKLIVTASDDQTAKVWEVKSLKLIADFKGHTDKVVTAIFTPDSSRVITASADRTARLWDVYSPKSVSGFNPKSVSGLRGHIGMLTSIAVTPQRSIAATGSEDTTARIWNTTLGGGIQIGDLSLKADREKYSGPCPVVITFNGAITVTSGAGAVIYRFVRSTGRPGPEKTLTFDSPGTKEVSTVWKFGGPNYPLLSGALYLEVVSPQLKKSTLAGFQVSCDLTPGSSSPTSVERLGPANGFAYATRPRAFELTWKAVPGATEYTIDVQQYSPNGRTWKSAYILPVTGTTVTLPVKPGWKQMRWRVSAGSNDTKAAWWRFSFDD